MGMLDQLFDMQGPTSFEQAPQPTAADWHTATLDKLMESLGISPKSNADAQPAPAPQVGFPDASQPQNYSATPLGQVPQDPTQLPPLPTRDVTPQPNVGMPYTATATDAPVNPTMAGMPAPVQPQGNVQPVSNPSGPFSPTFMDRMGALANGYSKGGLVGGIADAVGGTDRAFAAQNLTFQALVNNGLDPTTAKASVLNPDFMKSFLSMSANNQTYQALVTKGVPPVIAKAAAANPALLQQILPTVFASKAPTYEKLGAGESLAALTHDDQGRITSQDVTPTGRGPTDKTPEGRTVLATQYGLQPGTPAYQTYILNGKVPDVTPDHKAIEAADSSVQAAKDLKANLQRARQLSDTTYSGLGANTRAYAMNQVPFTGGGTNSSNDTIDYDNIVQSSILPSLKTVFPGRITNTDLNFIKGLQGMSDMSVPNRNRVLDRSIAHADELIANKQAEASQLRTGGYFQPGGGVPQVTQAGPPADALTQARNAIANGANRDQVIARLRQNNVDPAGL